MSRRNQSTFVRPDMCKRFEIAFTNHYPLIVYDLETTGVKRSDVIVQFSGLKLEYSVEKGGYLPTKSLTLYIKPPFPMPAEASAVNHITDEMLQNAPSASEAFPRIREFFGDVSANSTTVVCGYNITKFDNAMMDVMYSQQSGENFEPNKVVDIMYMAMEVLDRDDLPDRSFNQTTCASMYGIQEEHMHSADTDTLVSSKLMFRLYHTYKDQEIDYAAESKKPRIHIVSMSNFKKSRYVNYVIIPISAVIDGQTQTGRVYYDRYNRKYVQSAGNLFELCNRLQFTADADSYAGGNIYAFKQSKEAQR